MMPRCLYVSPSAALIRRRRRLEKHGVAECRGAIDVAARQPQVGGVDQREQAIRRVARRVAVHDRFVVRGLCFVELLELRVDEAHVVEQRPDVLAQSRGAIGRRGSTRSARARRARSPRMLAMMPRFCAIIALRRSSPVERCEPCARAYSALGLVEIAAKQMAACHAVVGVSDARRLTVRLGDRQRGGQAVERDVELAVVDVRSRDASQDRRRDVAMPRREQIQRGLVLVARELALARAL